MVPRLQYTQATYLEANGDVTVIKTPSSREIEVLSFNLAYTAPTVHPRLDLCVQLDLLKVSLSLTSPVAHRALTLDNYDLMIENLHRHLLHMHTQLKHLTSWCSHMYKTISLSA